MTAGAVPGQVGAEPRGATGTPGGRPASTPGKLDTMPEGTANESRPLTPGSRKGSATPAAVYPADGAAVVSGTLPRGATGTACGGSASGPGEVGGGIATFGTGTNSADCVTGSAVPAAVLAADVAAVASGTLPRGATAVVCGGLSGPGRALANSWLASAASSASLMGSSPSASTDRYSLVLMELVHRHVVEDGESVIGEHGERGVQRHEV